MTNDGEWNSVRPVHGWSAVSQAVPIIMYNDYVLTSHDAASPICEATTIKVYEGYKKGNKIFIGLDTCANVHSVPYVPWLRDPERTAQAIGTSGGATSARMLGNFAFTVDLFNENKKQRVDVSRALGLPDSGLPLLSVSLMKRSGFKFYDTGYLGFKHGNSVVKIDCVNGLYGMWATPIVPEIHPTVNATDQLALQQPRELLAQQPRAETIDFPLKISNKYWSEYNENRGDFTHQVFTTVHVKVRIHRSYG